MEQLRTEQLLIDAMCAAVHNKQVEWTDVTSDGWRALMNLAAVHKVQPLVLQAAFHCPAAQQWGDLLQQKREAKLRVMLQTIQTTEFLQFYKFLHEKNMRPLVVKGILCRALYPCGELRQSADEDIYVPEAEFFRYCEAAQEYGMQAITKEADTENAFEIGWRKTNSPLYIELHRSLFSPDSDAVRNLQAYFSDAFTRAESYQVEAGAAVLSLCPHDHLLYLLLHAYKHFIHSGFGIRQVCDIGLWAQKYAERIAWDRLYAQCRQAHAVKFSAAVFKIAHKYLELEFTSSQVWNDISVDCEPMLADLLRAGIYGSADKGRQHSATVTLNAVSARRKHRVGSILPTIFPPLTSLQETYPILKKHPYLLPLAWCKRLRKYYTETKATPNNTAMRSLQISKERKKLLQLYDIL